MSHYGTSRHNHRTISGCASELKHFVLARYSIAHERHPDRNEDSLIADDYSGLAAVFDGVGGSAAGEIASRTAAHATLDSWRQTLRRVQPGRLSRGFLDYCDKIDLPACLEGLIEQADDLVRTAGAKRAGTDDLATTVALAALCQSPSQKGYTMFHAHVGDSRIYLLRGNEPLKRLTSDDGLLGKLVENKIITETDALRIDQARHIEDLTDVELSYFRLRGGITQALGGPVPPTIHTSQTTIYPGDRVLLCTDGIHDNLTDQEITDILKIGARTSVARILVEHALERSHQERHTTIRAKPDDMTAVVITCRF
ncbi:MAG: serine/threonine-protein phosphatase [Ktedonobacteraceae bacterium]|nr:serine/threonine-protein phosphatase [Ktedonobacteraceae bacterium]